MMPKTEVPSFLLFENLAIQLSHCGTPEPGVPFSKEGKKMLGYSTLQSCIESWGTGGWIRARDLCLARLSWEKSRVQALTSPP